MPGSAFDNLQNLVFDTAKGLYGYDASWTAVDSGAAWTGKVLFKNPTEQYQLGVAQFQYDPYRYEMEYKFGDFEGLKERVDKRSTDEVVTIDGKEYFVRAVDTLFDGKTYKATLTPVADV